MTLPLKVKLATRNVATLPVKQLHPRNVEFNVLVKNLRPHLASFKRKRVRTLTACRKAAAKVMGISYGAVCHYAYGTREVSESTLRLARLVLCSNRMAERSTDVAVRRSAEYKTRSDGEESDRA